MRLQVLSVLAAALLVAACESTPESGAAATGSGQTTAAPAPVSTAPTSAVRPGSQEDLAINVGDRVFYDFDKYDLKPEARQTLERQAAWLKRYPSVRFQIEGHADERGTREYNLALGERRANAARDYLVTLGIDPARLSTISYGKERPAVLGSNEAAWSQNRRAVAVVR
ncbi:MAG: peptidoglycan-associated lipoprotein Pal [Thalassobaculales bacterium]